MNYSQSRQMVIDRVTCVLRIVTILLLLVTLLFGRQNKMLVAANVLISLSVLVLWVSQRQYIHEGKMGLFVWNNYSANETDMLLCAMMPPLILAIRALQDFLIFDWLMLISVALIASLVMGIGLLLIARAKKQQWWLYACACIILFLCMMGICAQLNFALDRSEPEILRCQVVDHEKEESASRRDNVKSFYCIVATETGEEWKIPVTRAQYDSILKGNTVSVTVCEGAFGISYAYIENQRLLPQK